MRKYKVGDKVKLKPREQMQHYILDNNNMLARAGSVVTLREEWEAFTDSEQYFYIEEDQHETHCNKLPG